MKIRIKGNSVRYRLTKTDIENLAKNGFLQEDTNFVGKTLFYVLKGTNDSALTINFDGDSITLSMPNSMVTELVKTDRVGFSDKTGTVHLLVEKDFTCLENVEEDQSDHYPNPLAQKT